MHVNGEEISGTWVSSTGASGTFDGRKSGDQFEIALSSFEGCYWTFTGMVSGCVVSAELELSCNAPTTAAGWLQP